MGQKKIALNSLFTALALIGCINPASAQNFELNLNTPIPSDNSEPRIFVDNHVFFLMDLSASMSTMEKQLMFQGILNSFYHPEVQMSLDSGNHIALTFVAYGDTPHATETYIINSVSEGLMATNDAIWNPEENTAIARINLGSTTTMMSGLAMIENIMINDTVDAHNTSVIVIGDAAPTDATLSARQIYAMTHDLRISFFFRTNYFRLCK